MPTLCSSCSRLALSTQGELREHTDFVLMILVPGPERVPCHRALPSTQSRQADPALHSHPLAHAASRSGPAPRLQLGPVGPRDLVWSTPHHLLLRDCRLSPETFPSSPTPPPQPHLPSVSLCLLRKTSPCSPSLFLSLLPLSFPQISLPHPSQLSFPNLSCGYPELSSSSPQIWYISSPTQHCPQAAPTLPPDSILLSPASPLWTTAGSHGAGIGGLFTGLKWDVDSPP